MAQNFIPCHRDQDLLLPPSLRDWLPAGHLVWFVLDAVAEMDLGAFYASYRGDGWGRAAHDPAMMLALLVYAYAIGERSSRRIERRCHEDVAFRVIAANQTPDHATIARFRVRHETALGDLFGEVLALCGRAGMVSVGVIAVDGTKVHADAGDRANRSFADITREILAEADAVDAAEDERFGEARGDELPPELADPAERRRRLREARRALDAERAAREEPVAMQRQERLRDARRRLDAERAANAQSIARDRRARLERAYERLTEDWLLEARGEAEHQTYRQRGISSDGARRMGRAPRPAELPDEPTGTANVTDPDSRTLKTHRGYLQGYNAQAVTTEQQIIIAAEMSSANGDMSLLEPMVRAAQRELATAGVAATPGTVLADAGYWNAGHIQTLAGDGVQTLAPPEARKRATPRPGRVGGLYTFMRNVLAADHGRAVYAKRQGMIEPVFGDLKHNRRGARFQRRGHAACRLEWRLMTATHNLLKLWRHTSATAAA
jgi:transposase